MSRQTALISLSYTARCIDPRHPDCGWTWEGPDSDREAARHAGELKGGPSHSAVAEGKPE